MNTIQISLAFIFLLVTLALFLLLKLNPFEAEKNPLKQRRLYIAGGKLKITERIVIRFTTLFRQTGYTLKKFMIKVAASVAGGFLGGVLLFNSAGLALIAAVCFIPAPYFF